MHLISDFYRELNRELHGRIARYGANGGKWAETVRQIYKKTKSKSILDYGAGKQSLARELSKYDIRSYDPAVPGIDHLPEPADLVCCLDVIEHVEPECTDAVISHIRSLALKAIFVVIACKASSKILTVGRDAHINVCPIVYSKKKFGPSTIARASSRWRTIWSKNSCGERASSASSVGYAMTAVTPSSSSN